MPTSKAPRSRTNPKTAAFTLIEVLVVLFIMGLAMAVVLPRLTLPGARIKSEASRTAALIRSLSMSSVARKETIPLTIDMTARQLRWTERGEERRIDVPNLAYVELISRGQIRDGQVILSFGPLRPPENMVLRFTEEGRAYNVRFNPISRRVVIDDTSG